MQNRIVSYPIALVVMVAVAGMIFLSRLNTQATAQSQETKRATQWEYCFVTNPYAYERANNWVVSVSYGGSSQIAETDVTGVSALNKLGAEGWELVGISNTSDKERPTPTSYIFKRPKR